MKSFIVLVVATFFLSSSLFAADLPKSKCASVYLDNVSLDIDNGSLVMTSRSDGKYIVRITDKDELYVNGQFVETGAYEKGLLNQFRNDTIHLIESAKEVGYEGAKIGIKAVMGLVEVVCTDLQLEEFEVELEKEAERIEIEAEELEVLAEGLEDLHYELKLRISELGELDSF